MKLKDLIKTKENWTQGTSARDEYGNSVSLFSEKSCSYCLNAGLIKIYPRVFEMAERWKALDKLAKAINTLNPKIELRDYSNLIVINFNDDPKTTFEDIKKIIELADV